MARVLINIQVSLYRMHLHQNRNLKYINGIAFITLRVIEEKTNKQGTQKP